MCLQQNPAVLARLLYLKSKPFDFSPGSLRKILKSLKRFLGYVKNYIQYQLSLGNVSILELPFYGHLCLQVGRGYKVFDLHRETVTKIFKPEIDKATVVSEIEGMRRVGQYDFAPSIRHWNVKERWYEEDYVNGYRITSPDSTVILNTYYQYIAPCIENMILCQQPPRATNVAEYINKTISIFSNKLLEEKLDMGQVHTITSFVDSMAEQLYIKRNCQVYLGLSHGDFGHNHVIKTKHGTKIIDWEYMGHRSILFDFYNCFFVQLFLNRTIPNLVSEINNALSSLQSRLNLKAPQIANSLLPLARIYRWVFYIERICSVVELRGLDLGCMVRWIDVFNHYEEIIASGHQSV